MRFKSSGFSITTACDAPGTTANSEFGMARNSGGVLDGHEVVVAHDYESGRRDPTEVVDGDVRLALQHLRELAEEEKRRTSAGASSVCCAN